MARKPRHRRSLSLTNNSLFPLSLFFLSSAHPFSLSSLPSFRCRAPKTMAFLRSVPRRCCAGKKLARCGAPPLAVVGLLENAAAATTTATTTTTAGVAAAVTRAPPPLRLVAQVRGYGTSSSSSSSAASAATDVKKQRQQQQSALPRQIDPLDLKFNDPIAAFKSKTTMELLRAYVVYQMCSIEYIVEHNMKVRECLLPASLHVYVYMFRLMFRPLGQLCTR